jgi:uncharacterized protein (DUF2249 family)
VERRTVGQNDRVTRLDAESEMFRQSTVTVSDDQRLDPLVHQLAGDRNGRFRWAGKGRGNRKDHNVRLWSQPLM